jgi:hypothetical protein
MNIYIVWTHQSCIHKENIGQKRVNALLVNVGHYTHANLKIETNIQSSRHPH